GLVNTVTDRAGFKRQVQMVLTMRSMFATGSTVANSPLLSHHLKGSFPYATLGGTPLYAGMMLMERHVERMKRTLKLDKVMGVVISDGGDTASLIYKTQTTGYGMKLVENNQALGETAFVARDT